VGHSWLLNAGKKKLNLTGEVCFGKIHVSLLGLCWTYRYLSEDDISAVEGLQFLEPECSDSPVMDKLLSGEYD
jgi:hypothetical protein